VRARTGAQPRRGGEDDRGEQDHRRIEAQHRGHAAGDREDEAEQPSRAPSRARRHQPAHRIEEPLAPAALGQHEEGREEADGRAEIADRVPRVGCAERP
jgi:hypothetical protein